jgi:hypothetical protein
MVPDKEVIARAGSCILENTRGTKETEIKRNESAGEAIGHPQGILLIPAWASSA